MLYFYFYRRRYSTFSIDFKFLLLFHFIVYGGIYLDWDEIMLRSVEELRKFKYTQVRLKSRLRPNESISIYFWGRLFNASLA